MIKKIIEYMLSLVIILECFSVYDRCLDKNLDMFFLISMIFLQIILLMIVFKENRILKKNFKVVVLFCVMYIGYIMVFTIFNKINGIQSFIFGFGIIFTLFVVIYSISNESENIMKYISNWIIIIAVISLFFYFFASTFKIIAPNSKLFIEWGGKRYVPSYFGIYFETQNVRIFGKDLIRNTGIFPEAPMFSLVLTIVFAYELCIAKKSNKFRKSILLITIATTFSATGIVISSILLLIKYLLKKETKNTGRLIKILFIPIVILGVYLVCDAFLGQKYGSTSYNTRLDDYIACFKAWKQHKIMGNGHNNMDDIRAFMSSFRDSNQGMSNSLMIILAMDGLYLLLLYIMALINIVTYALKTKNINLIIFALTMVVLLVTTMFQFKIILLNLLAIAYSKKIKILTNEVSYNG